jgi:hypothetical protein
MSQVIFPAPEETAAALGRLFSGDLAATTRTRTHHRLPRTRRGTSTSSSTDAAVRREGDIEVEDERRGNRKRGREKDGDAEEEELGETDDEEEEQWAIEGGGGGWDVAKLATSTGWSTATRYEGIRRSHCTLSTLGQVIRRPMFAPMASLAAESTAELLGGAPMETAALDVKWYVYVFLVTYSSTLHAC